NEKVANTKLPVPVFGISLMEQKNNPVGLKPSGANFVVYAGDIHAVNHKQAASEKDDYQQQRDETLINGGRVYDCYMIELNKSETSPPTPN
ncbi:22405_t:CDS:2, partial [Gigaspora rosea]